MLKVENLHVAAAKNRELLHNVSLTVKRKQIIGLMGHSGAGKTTLIKTIMGILNKKCTVNKGNIYVDEQNLCTLTSRERRRLCGTVLGFIPQNPMTAFDTRRHIDKQMIETYRRHLQLSKEQCRQLAKDTLKLVNLLEVDRILKCYPHELSGGMLQRVTIAILLGLKPSYIIADEPISALDEENGRIILNLIKEISENTGILIASHHYEALDEICHHIYTLNQGQLSPFDKKSVKSYKEDEGEHFIWKALS